MVSTCDKDHLLHPQSFTSIEIPVLLSCSHMQSEHSSEKPHVPTLVLFSSPARFIPFQFLAERNDDPVEYLDVLDHEPF